ncbi:Putative protein of unknown function [Podospora comata]|uniref:Ankyrin n=1 Tax=Podospora comata TaxID=48703 RepID=A0ABY6SFW3_PODCO|nr:Putative protein of unknown function [Podospora comata]
MLTPKSAVLKTPLHLAAENDKLEAAHLLVCQGANTLVKDKGGRCPTEYAIMRGHTDMFELLIQDTGDTRYTGALPQRDFVTSVQRSAVDIVRCILDRLPRIENSSGGVDSFLHIAARDSNGEIIKLLRDRLPGLDTNHAGVKGTTPIHDAVAHKNVEALQQLLKANRDLEKTDEDGKTPLLLSVRKGMSPGICRLLLNAGAAKLLLEHGAVNNPGKTISQSQHYKAAYTGNSRTVEVLLSFKAEVNWHNSQIVVKPPRSNG